MSSTQSPIEGRFLVLENAETATSGPEILGSVVYRQDITCPFANYRPNSIEVQANKDLKALTNKIWADCHRNSTPWTAVQVNLTQRNERTVKAQIHNLFSGRFGRIDVDGLEIVAGEGRTYAMKNPGGETLPESLVKNDAWFNAATKMWFDQEKPAYRKLCLVTGVLICKDIEVRFTREAHHEVGADGSLPVNQAVAAATSTPFVTGSTGNLSISVDRAKSNDKTVFAKCASDVIIGVSYADLKVVEDTPTEGTGLVGTLFGKKRKPATKLKSIKYDAIVRGPASFPYLGGDELELDNRDPLYQVEARYNRFVPPGYDQSQ